MNPLLFHHARPLAYCSPLVQHPHSEQLDQGDPLWDDQFKDAYAWLAKRIGYWPLFLSVGDDPDAWRMTGYQSQWSRLLSMRHQDGQRIATYRQPGEFPSLVLFSFDQLPPASFSSYHWWHCVLNGPEAVTKQEERKILRPHYSKEDWLRKAARSPGSVQAHVPQLDLGQAQRIWCRSLAAKKQLVEQGFDQKIIQVKRLAVDTW